MARASIGQRFKGWIGAKAKAFKDIWQNEEYGVVGKIIRSIDEANNLL